MEKEKLKAVRLNKGLSYQDMADSFPGMECHSYRRREKGVSKISNSEWKKFAEILEVDFESIFEPDYQVVNINKGNGQINNHTKRIEYYSLPKEMVDNQQDYINMIKAENEILKTEIKSLKHEIAQLRN